MIEQIHQQTGHGIRPICQVLVVPRSSYDHASNITPCQTADIVLGDLIEAIFKRHRRRYGYRRIHSDLSDQGIVCAAARVRRIMEERGLRAIQPKTYVPKTSDGRADKPSPNLLLENPLPEQSDKVWAGDITYIPTADGWRYLAFIIDLCSRRIVGWALADHMRTELVTDALKQAQSSRIVAPGLIFFTATVAANMAAARTGKCWNLQTSTRACQPVPHPTTTPKPNRSWAPSKTKCFREAPSPVKPMPASRSSISPESYYNHHRKHSSLSYQTPAQFEAKNETNN